MEKLVKDRLNALKSELAELRQPEMGKHYFDLTKELILEVVIEELKHLIEKNERLERRIS